MFMYTTYVEHIKLASESAETEFIMNHTFWVGVSQNLTEDDMAKTLKVIHDFVEEKIK